MVSAFEAFKSAKELLGDLRLASGMFFSLDVHNTTNVLLSGLMPAPTERVIHGANTQQIVAPPVQPAQAQAQPQSLLRGFMFWNMTFAKTVI